LDNTLIKQRAVTFRLPTFSARTFILPALAVVLGVTMIVSMGIGAVPVHPVDVIHILLEQIGLTTSGDIPSFHESVVLTIRLPRIILGVLVGACLGVCGAVLQGLFRNPLAEPALVGVSSGCSLGAVATIFYSGYLTYIFGEGSLVSPWSYTFSQPVNHIRI